MAKPQTRRLDELPLDRRIAGESRGVAGGAKLGALYERRDVEPNAPHVKRRAGSRRITNTSPNLLGVTQNGNTASVVVDYDFQTGIQANELKWTIFGTAYIPPASDTSTAVYYTRLISFDSLHIYLYKRYSGGEHQVAIRAYDHTGGNVSASSAYLDLADGDTIRFAVMRTAAGGTNVRVAAWTIGEAIATPDTGTYTFLTTTAFDKELKLFGENSSVIQALSEYNVYKEIVLNNVLVYNNDVFATEDYETFASNTEPATSIAAPGAALLLWHDLLSGGGNILSYTENGGDELNAYLRPSPPETFTSDPAVEPTDLHFGGEGVIEIPFYLDFDEYYWTSTNAAARLEWCFQLKITTPEVLDVGTIFELQDLLKLSIIPDGTDFNLSAVFNDETAEPLTSTVDLDSGTDYDVFVARDADSYYIKIQEGSEDAVTVTTTTISNPIVYEYDKTIGFLVGDRVDVENSDPFRGRIERFALHNSAELVFGDKSNAVFYYDVVSVQGDEIIDQGNRAINAYVGTRATTQPPYYTEGGFAGGSFVAAAGGYLISNASPDIGYSGQLRKPLTKDAVVQRRGKRSFLTSNGVSYLVDDRTDSIRPLGIPRPATKVSCTPQGVGPINGFVRYAYRFVTVDGTVGPVFELDPCDAQGGVNVFLGAETFGIPFDPAFGLSYGEAEKGTHAGDPGVRDTVECFFAADKIAGNETAALLQGEAYVGHPTAPEGLTLETAFRLPSAAANVQESVLSAGAYAPFGAGRWLALNAPKEFPWIGQANKECTIQFSFHFKSQLAGGEAYPRKHQTLFCIGAKRQHYETGLANNSHYKLHHLVVSIQAEAHPGTGSVETGTTNHNYAIFVTRDDPSGSEHRDNDLHHWNRDYNFIDNHDYTIFVSRGGSAYGHQPGTDLIVSIFDHTAHVEGGQNGWEMWPAYTNNDYTNASAAVAGYQENFPEHLEVDFYGPDYAGDASDEIMWGACRKEDQHTYGRTRVRKTGGGSVLSNKDCHAFHNGTLEDGTPGQRMYHARIWRRNFPLLLLQNKAFDRYGARQGPLRNGLEVDLNFAPDSAISEMEGGWDLQNGVRCKFYSPWTFDAKVYLATGISETVFLAYGFDNSITTNASAANTHLTTSTDTIPLWCSYSSRNGGSVNIGTGRDIAWSLAKKKWYLGSTVLTYEDFLGQFTVDLSQWTWITLFFEQIARSGSPSTIDVWLSKIYFNGNGSPEWSELYNADTRPEGPEGMTSNNAAYGDNNEGRYTLFSVGGVPGIDTAFEVEIAEARLWAGERYYTTDAIGTVVGQGTNQFGNYMSARVPPNYWDQLVHYLRFSPIDVNDMAAQATMDQRGEWEDGQDPPRQQAKTNTVTLYQDALIRDAGSEGGSGGSSYFIPFPTPPLPAIRGIQIFRSLITPVANEFTTGQANPNAKTDAFKACRAAALYYLSEIPDGTDFYFDSAIDDFLGGKLDVAEGLIPGNPGGVFEWAGFLGIWVTDIPRIHFAASPTSWESFPGDMVLDLPLREYGTIQAATELASRDARQSRVLVLGKSWGVFLDGSPVQPQVNSMGGGVGASSSRCLVVEKGIAYAYNGTLWAITGDGAIEDIGMPVLDLLPAPDSTRLSVSSALGSLYIIDESTGLTLRWHFARREWFVEDRHALSTTDIDGVDNWVHLSGFPSKGHATTYADDVESNTAASYTVASFNAGAKTITISSSVAGLKVGQRITVVADEDPRERATVTITAIDSVSLVLTVDEDGGETLSLSPTSANNLAGTTVTLNYKVRAGIGYWGTMLDTGQFTNSGVLQHVDLGLTAGDRWYAMSVGADFATDPTSRGNFDTPESHPTRIDDGAESGRSARWGLTARQRIQRLLIWSFEPSEVGLSELELNYSDD